MKAQELFEPGEYLEGRGRPGWFSVLAGDDNRKRYSLKGKTADGRNLTKFVKQADYDAADVPAL